MFLTIYNANLCSKLYRNIMCKYCHLIDHKNLGFIIHNDVNFKIQDKTFFGVSYWGHTAFYLFLFLNLKGYFTTFLNLIVFCQKVLKYLEQLI